MHFAGSLVCLVFILFFVYPLLLFQNAAVDSLRVDFKMYIRKKAQCNLKINKF